jgi:hypothetical protein
MNINKEHPLDEVLRWRSPKRVDEMFALVCFNNYIAGQFGQKIPVDKSREVFEKIKKLLKTKSAPLMRRG